METGSLRGGSGFQFGFIVMIRIRLTRFVFVGIEFPDTQNKQSGGPELCSMIRILLLGPDPVVNPDPAVGSGES